MKLNQIVLILLMFPLFANAQYLGGQSSDNHESVNESSLASIEGVTSKMLSIISGAKNEKRNWDEFRDLFLPTAQFISLNPKAKPGEQARALNIEEFIRMIGPLYSQQGFYEKPISISVDEFNGIANVFQSYEAKNQDGTYQARGINSFQLVYLDNRWWIANSTWTNETAEKKIPAKFLTNNTTTNPSHTPPTETKSNTSKIGKAKKGKIILKK